MPSSTSGKLNLMSIGLFHILHLGFLCSFFPLISRFLQICCDVAKWLGPVLARYRIVQLFVLAFVFEMAIRASHVQLFWIFMLFQAVNTVKLNFKAGLFSSTFQFEHSFLAKSQC